MYLEAAEVWIEMNRANQNQVPFQRPASKFGVDSAAAGLRLRWIRRAYAS